MLRGASGEMLVFESLLQQRSMHVAHQLVTACLAGGFVVELCELMARRMGWLALLILLALMLIFVALLLFLHPS